MPLPEEILGKLTTSLSSDIDLYNTIIGEVQKADSLVSEKDQQIEKLKTELAATEERAKGYINQIGNLVSQIPVSNATQQKSANDKFNEIKSREWTK